MSDEEINAFFEHHGIKGMHWGVRKAERGGVSRSVDKQAQKDAKEFARAKLFFGEGAGTRRKLIKTSVEARKKHDPSYAKAFERHLSKQDLSVHATKAVKERTRIDRKDRTKKQAGFIARKFTGEMGTQAAFTAAALGGAAFLSSPKGKAIMKNTHSKISGFAKSANNERLRRQGAAHISNLLKNMK